MDAEEAAEAAKRNMSRVLKKSAYATASISEEGEGWKATVEIVEEQHMPTTFDTIGIYEVRLDQKGKLLQWEKKGSRQRG